VSPLKKVSSIAFLAFDLWWGILKSLFIGEAFIHTQDLGVMSNGGVELKYGLAFSLPFTPPCCILVMVALNFLSLFNAINNPSGPLAPSSHKIMRYKPFLGTCNPKTQKMRKQKGNMMESGKYGWEWYDGSSRRPPVAPLFPGVTTLTRIPG
jgi:hypothetical protein